MMKLKDFLTVDKIKTYLDDNKQVKLNLLCIDYFNALNDKTINLSKHKVKKEFNAILEDMEKERLREIRRVDDRLIKMMQDLTNDY